MLTSTTFGNKKNINNTFFSHITPSITTTFTSAINNDVIPFYGIGKRFIPLEFTAYMVSRTGTTGATLQIGNTLGGSQYGTITLGGLSTGGFAATTATTTAIPLGLYDPMYYRIATQNPFSTLNIMVIVVTIAGYLR